MTDAPEHVREVTLSCRCGHSWTAEVLSGVSLAQWTTHLELQVCQHCQAPYRVTSQRSAA